MTFAGQGVDVLDELSTLVAQRPELLSGVELASDVLAEVARSDLGLASGAYRHGTDVAAWVMDPDGAPPLSYLRGAAVAYPLSLVAQALLWRAVFADALEPAVGSVLGFAGHSQGLLAAALVAEAPGGVIDDALLARHLRSAAVQGLAMSAAAVGRSPMAAVDGVTLERLEPLLTGEVSVALVNTRTRIVLAGPPTDLEAVRARLAACAADEAAARREGQLGGAPLRFEWTPLAVDVPFHSPALDDALAGFEPLGVGERWAPVLGADDLARAQFVDPVRWDRVAGEIRALGADWVLDFGPGTAVARMTAENLRGSGVRVLALASPEGRRVLTSPGAAPAGRDVTYADFAPGVVNGHLDTKYTRATGRPPVILAGMTPTTVDAGIVAAAANAGYMAELAGGGQPDRRTFDLRVEELAGLLEPGREVVFNTLLLDRHLWELHVSRDALLLGARRAGAPFAGLTVSAGIPDVDEAIALLDELAAVGMRVNAFKPGTAEQVRQLLAIADAAPHHTIAAHLEGGRAGGHHSWEDLEELLLETYHELRRRPNVLVCAGGGIGTPARAAELLHGTWALVHGVDAMPVDAVLIGTAAMACLEATASPQVKAALVAAGGSAEWVPRRGVDGGVTSARSNLNADIHLLDNAASRAGHLLESVAGDEAAVLARRSEIADALSRTAKPYFGELAEMTYGDVLARFRELCAIGRGRRYDDGEWGHPSWRARYEALLARFAARLAPEERGPVAAVVDEAVAARTLLHPADAQFFLEVCDRPGKPVPFVPVLDAEVRRWYMADGLWQAQDDRLGVDEVFVIPGPEAVAGIERVDEPVAELLARFEAEAVARVRSAPVARPRLADPGPAPEPLASLRADGVVGELLAVQCVVTEDGRTLPNPLWRLVAPGDAIDQLGDVITVRPADAPFESVVIEPAAGSRPAGASDEPARGEVVGTRAPGAGEPARGEVVVTAGALALRFAVRDGAVFEVEGEAARAAFAVSALDPGSSWSCPAELPRAYRAATGAAHDGVPLDLAWTLAWPAVCDLLATPELAARFHELVHATHAVEPGEAWPPRPGESGPCSAWLVELSDPAGAPTRLRCRARVESERGLVATVDAELAILGDAAATDVELRRHDFHNVELTLREAGDADFLAEQPWLELRDELRAGDVLHVRAETTLEVPRGGEPRWTATGTVARAGEEIGTITECSIRQPLVDQSTTRGTNPVAAVLDLLATPGPERHARPGALLATAEDVAPTSMEAFARVGGDRNPLHRSVLAARLAGLKRPIVHGAWTAARASAFVVDELCDGDAQRLREWRIGFLAPVPLGAVLDFEASRAAIVDGRRVLQVRVRANEVDVALGEAVLDAPPTALVFPGQGIQRTGLGAEGRARSRAARAVWTRADAHTRAALGFSLLEVVEDNPRELRLADGHVARHPEGVLFRTEFTQTALIALAAAQLEELRAEGALGAPHVAAGHSVGEFAALYALGAIELEAALTLVWHRGLAMQNHVPRAADGSSPYRLAVVKSTDGLGEDVEIVNLNAPDRQYAIVGTADAIAALGRAARVVPGIDIPFHSSVLRGAVDELRPHVAAAGIDASKLVGRWVPNVLARPLEPGDDVVELLAQQLASPVRWIECQQALAGLADRFLELAPPHAAVLTGLARMTVPGVTLLHAEHDRDLVLDRAEASAPVTDKPVDAGDALEFVLALQARVRLDQLDPSESVDELFQGVSSRRNQVLIDLGREFGLSGAEGVQRQTIGELVKTLREQGAGYRFPGPYLKEALATGLTRAGVQRTDLGLPPGLTDHVFARVALDTRPGPSARGGDLARLPAGPDLLDRARELTSADLKLPLARAAAPEVAAAPVAVANPALEDALLDSARTLADALGRPLPPPGEPLPDADPDQARLAILDAELGPERAQEIAPRFDARRHVRFTSAWASARWDLVTAYHDALAGRLDAAGLGAEIDRIAAHGGERAVAETAAYLSRHVPELTRVTASDTWTALPLAGVRPTVTLDETGVPHTGTAPDDTRPIDLLKDMPDELVPELAVSLKASPDLRHETALITGAAPNSIGAELAKRLLRGGAKVVIATSTLTPERRRFYRELYRTSAGPRAELHVVPANLASFADVDALAAWLRHPGGGRRGRDDLRGEPLTPTALAPFPALSATAEAGGGGGAFETAFRVQLLGVQRLIGAVRPRTVLLPLSPNHGAFGSDGPYGETKAALEVLTRRAQAEPWGAHTTFIAPKIGWVRGTNLMRGNDAIAPLVEERLNVRTFATDEMAWLLTGLLVTNRAGAIDLTGGLGAIDDLRGALQPLADELRDRSARAARAHTLRRTLHPPTPADQLEALPSPGTDTAPPTPGEAPPHDLRPQDMVVIVGTGELGPGGTGRSRFALELGEIDSPGVVAELAWLTGLVGYELEHYRGRWIDTATKEEVREEDLAARYADAVAERIGVRALESDGTIEADGHTVLAPVTLEQPVTFTVDSEAEARTYPNATVRRDGDRFLVTIRGQIRVPRIVAQTRRVAGQLPTGLDLARLGVPNDLIATADRMALVNLAATVEAFADAGLEPQELLDHVHPANVANTQGAGMGGMASLRRLLLDHLLDQERQNDRVQESLGNVVAAHAVQTYLGSYGPMIHPVGACATAAVSLEVAYDKITSGKALAVLAGGFDDLTPEGMIGFADMGATAASDELEAMDLEPREASRANDTRRAGFVEAQGGGAQLVVRGDVALALGLPVRGVLAYAGSFADGLHTSIPAAGLGALAAAQPLNAALVRHGLTADDLGVVSKHDTSTDMNDPNEADLHDRLQTALQRTPGNPLLVVSQKTVTGHAKGGAAAWQLDGVLRMLETGRVPGNRNLESVDPLLEGNRHLALGDRPIDLAVPLRAALIASLGFGHVSAILAVAHPDTFHAAVPQDQREDYLQRAGRRRAEGVRRRLEMRLGRPPLVRRPRALDRDAEAALLLDR
ncbi:DUF1729 domain-containing protein [Solirubrobacter sp. CPCC 204708]|uniref:DUF1729 domain-containing protein n=1 Tax=Solirubrobacter deserti TaxID=2282478 RepID=A0ABT4RDF3_9ACTN|nr:DUF1729 domain-containing protein [Solirubrobacter deserti]